MTNISVDRDSTGAARRRWLHDIAPQTFRRVIALSVLAAIAKATAVNTFVLAEEGRSLAMLALLLLGFFVATLGLVLRVLWLITRSRGDAATADAPRQAPPDYAPRAEPLEDKLARFATRWDLSPTERDIALFVLKGYSNKEIARLRNCAPTTVRNHLSSVYRKSDLKTRYQFIAFLSQEGPPDAEDRA